MITSKTIDLHMQVLSPPGERQNRHARLKASTQSQHRVKKRYGRRSILNINAEFVSKFTEVSAAYSYVLDKESSRLT